MTVGRRRSCYISHLKFLLALIAIKKIIKQKKKKMKIVVRVRVIIKYYDIKLTVSCWQVNKCSVFLLLNIGIIVKNGTVLFIS